jgi:hypothetical protein
MAYCGEDTWKDQRPARARHVDDVFDGSFPRLANWFPLLASITGRAYAESCQRDRWECEVEVEAMASSGTNSTKDNVFKPVASAQVCGVLELILWNVCALQFLWQESDDEVEGFEKG